MKKKFSKLVNKNMKAIVVILIIVAIALGFLLMLISGNDEERDQVPIDPTAEQTDDSKDKKERKLAQSNDHPGVSNLALNMYNARVDDISDTAQVAQLLEATDMRTELGDYLVTLNIKGDTDTLVIAFDKMLLEGEENAFNEQATWYAEQFLALIDEADVVKWTYTIEGVYVEEEKTDDSKKSDSDSKKSSEDENKEKELALQTQKLTLKQANELLNVDDIKSYSETPELVQTLLNNQKGII